MSTDNQDKPNAKETTEKIGEAAQNVAQKTYGDFLGAYKSFSETTSKVIQQAASVLESEIAAGVKIANQAENKFPQVEKFRAERPDEVMQRFRRDAHEVIDIFIDLIGATVKSIPNLNEANFLRPANNVAVKPEQTQAPAPAPAPAIKKPVIMPPKAVKAGETAEIEISFENNRNVETEEFKLYSTDLISNTGDRLPSTLVTFEPQTLKINPYQNMQIKVTIAIPEETVSGTYTGLVLASNMSELRSEIVIKVE